MADLSLINTQEMLDELQKRFESIVFVGNRDYSDREDHSTYHYAGNYLTLLGLLSRISYKMLKDMDELAKDDSE